MIDILFLWLIGKCLTDITDKIDGIDLWKRK